MRKRFSLFSDVRLMKDLRQSRLTITVYIVLRSVVVLGMFLSALGGRWENFFVSALALVLFLAPSILEHRLKIDLPTPLEIVILLFVFAAMILGELEGYYSRYPFWDAMLHTVNGFLFSAVGFALVDLLNRGQGTRFHLSPLYLAIAAFCFSMTIGVLWEFFEFGMDLIFGTDMQKDTVLTGFSSMLLDPTGLGTVHFTDIQEVVVDGVPLGIGGYLDIGLYDTMKDLMVNFIGAVVFSVIGYFYVKNRGRGAIARSFIPRVMYAQDKEDEV